MKIILTPKITFQILLEIQVSIASYLLIFSIRILCPLPELSMLNVQFVTPTNPYKIGSFSYHPTLTHGIVFILETWYLFLSFPLLK